MQRNRPAGVAFIAVWFFLNGLSALSAALVPLFFLDLFTGLGMTGATPILAAVIMLLIAAAYFAIGWSLWELRDWARLATIALAGIGLVIQLIAGVLLIVGFQVADISIRFMGAGLASLLGAVVNGLVIWYLMKPDIQALFTGAGVATGDVGVTWEQTGGAVSFSGGATAQEATGVPTAWESGATPGAGTVPSTVREAPPPAVSRPIAPPVDKTRPLQEPEPVAGWLVIRSGPRVNQQLKLHAGSNIIGRDGRKSQLVVEEPSVSGEHAKIRFENGVFVIYDLASTNGTYVNGHRVEKQRLMDNDLIRLGRMEFVFKVVDPRHRSS